MKYIVYQVDPNELAAGTPIESLNKKNHKVIEHGIALPSDPGNFKNRGHLYQSDFAFKPPKRKEISTLEVDAQIYQRVIKTQMVKVTGGNPGQIYKVVNLQTGSFVMRQLYPIGEYKYLARVI